MMKNRTVAVFLLLLVVPACSSKKVSPTAAKASAASTASAAPGPSASASEPTPPAIPTVVPPDGAKIEHIMISYKGAMQAEPTQTRTKEQAKKLAKEIVGKLKKGQSFEELAKKYSDDKTIGLGILRRDQMLKPFAEVVFDLKAGGTSDVVETGYGFHVIRRVE